MKAPAYPFSAIVGQEQMKLALLLSAVDWRVSVLLRGEKGAGKTTTARALAALLSTPAPFINVPIGTTEDRLLGGLHLERTLQGDPVLKPGLLSEAHGGVLYIDEVNLLAPHLGDSILDTASSGINIVEREGLSASHPAEFVLLGSMNPEEGSLRPQLLDRFALSVEIAAPLDPTERKLIVERRLAFERSASSFAETWGPAESTLRNRVQAARSCLTKIGCSEAMLSLISETVCAYGVRSLRADLAAVRAAAAYAALIREASVQPSHIQEIMPLVLAHRAKERSRPQSPTPPPSSQQDQNQDKETSTTPNEAIERIFTPCEVNSVVAPLSEHSVDSGRSASSKVGAPGQVVGSHRSEDPVELDIRTTLRHSLLDTGQIKPRISDLHEKVRDQRANTRYLLLIDSSGSHAVQERMRLVKGVASSLIAQNFKHGDEIAILTFRGTAAQVALEPTTMAQDALDTLEYLPTGGRTPLAHALNLARTYITSSTVLIVVTDGRANVPLRGGDAWQDALQEAAQITIPSLVIDTEIGAERLGQATLLASALSGECLSLQSLEFGDEVGQAFSKMAIREMGS